jgi:hypothetical protein
MRLKLAKQGDFGYLRQSWAGRAPRRADGCAPAAQRLRIDY